MPFGDSPSIVTTFWSGCSTDSGNTQERIGWPSRWTVQAPQAAIPQPYFVPVNPT